MTATMVDLVNDCAKAWSAADIPTRTALRAIAETLVAQTSRPDSTALGIAEGIILAGAEPLRDRITRSATIVGLIALAYNWSIDE